MDLKSLGEHVASSLPGAVLGQSIAFGELSLTLDPARLVETVTFLRDDPACSFICFIDTTAVDYPEREKRFEVVTHLLSPRHVQRIRLKVDTDERTPVPTLTGIYDGAVWFEREVWDLFGVFFAGHPDMRRLLTDYGFDGHPLRKRLPDDRASSRCAGTTSRSASSTSR